jgi:DNA-binding NtrC family response regulator
MNEHEDVSPEDTTERPYLILWEGEATRLCTLPADGELVVGSEGSCDVCLIEPLAAPRHAAISVSDGEVRLRALSGAPVTRVNGQELGRAERLLVGGDAIAIGAATLVYHAPRKPPATRLSCDLITFRERAAVELERSLRTRLPWALLVVRLPGADRARAEASLLAQLRGLDLTCWDGDEQVLVLLPDTDVGGGRVVAARLLEALGSVSPDATIGLASFPADGCHLDDLLAQARGAALSARAEKIRHPGPLTHVIPVGAEEVLVADPAMFRLYALLDRLARADLPVLIEGETGTGKELIAAKLHYSSARRDAPFVTVNCAAIPENLVESELFGHERGAFSGAAVARLGLIASADGGTLLLDEVGELPAPAQAKLLRVLETKRLRAIGEVRERHIDVRVVSATNRDLTIDVQSGRFRKDLYFRLRGAMVRVPPLRERRGELPALVSWMLTRECVRLGRSPMAISGHAMLRLLAYDWPGNVRELKSLVELAAAVAGEPTLEAGEVESWMAAQGALPVAASSTPQRFRPLHAEIEELERRRIHEALTAATGNQVVAAGLISMPLRTFRAKVKRYRLQGAGR